VLLSTLLASTVVLSNPTLHAVGNITPQLNIAPVQKGVPLPKPQVPAYHEQPGSRILDCGNVFMSVFSNGNHVEDFLISGICSDSAKLKAFQSQFELKLNEVKPIQDCLNISYYLTINSKRLGDPFNQKVCNGQKNSPGELIRAAKSVTIRTKHTTYRQKFLNLEQIIPQK